MNTNTTLALTLGALLILAVGLAIFARHQVTRQRARFITRYRFPARLEAKVRGLHPHLTAGKARLAIEGLRQYFLTCLAAQSRGIARHVGMPSKAADDAWHEFLLMEREYAEFCARAFGRHLTHVPDAEMKEPMGRALANTLHQLRRASPGPEGWAMMGAVPLLFAIDRELGVKDGFLHDEASLAQLHQKRGTDGGGGAFGCAGTSFGHCDSGSSDGCDSGGGSCGGGCGSS